MWLSVPRLALLIILAQFLIQLYFFTRMAPQASIALPCNTTRIPKLHVSGAAGNAEIGASPEQTLDQAYLLDLWRETAAKAKREAVLRACAAGTGTCSEAVRKGGLRPAVERCEELGPGKEVITVVTLNLQNVEQWPARQGGLQDRVGTWAADVLAMQEVREEAAGRLQHLSLVPASESCYARARLEATGGEEGVALHCRPPACQFAGPCRSVQLSPSAGAAARVLLLAPLLLRGRPVLAGVVHLGLDDQEQCRHVLELMRETAASPHLLLLGDFNAYFDFQWPADYLTMPVLPPFFASASHPCAAAWHHSQLFNETNGQRRPLMDVVEALGLTRASRRLKGLQLEADLALDTIPVSLAAKPGDDSTRADRVLARGLLPCALHYDDWAGQLALSDHCAVLARLLLPDPVPP